MAVATYVSNGTPVSVTTTGAPGYPTSFAAGDLIFLAVASGDSTVGAAPAGFTLVLSVTQGSVNLRVFQKDTVTGSESGTVTVTTSAGTKGRAWMTAYRPPSGYTTAVQASVALNDAASDTSVAVTGTMTTTTDDLLVAFVMGAGDFTAGAFTGFNLTQTGATLGSLDTATAGRTGTNTLQHFQLDKPVTTGATSATVTATGTGNATGATGAGVGLVLRSTIIAGAGGYPVTLRWGGAWITGHMKVRWGGAWVTPVSVSVITNTTPTTPSANMPWDLPATYAPTSPPVMGHYFTQFPLKQNDLVYSAPDYYKKYWVQFPSAVENGGTDWSVCGGWLRDHPIDRAAPIGGNWQLTDMIVDVKRMIAAGLDGAFTDLLSATTTNNHWKNILRLFDASDSIYAETGKRFWVTPMIDGTASPSMLTAGNPTASGDALADALAPLLARAAIWKYNNVITLPVFGPEKWPSGSLDASDRITFFNAMRTRFSSTYGITVNWWMCYVNTWNASDTATNFNGMAGVIGHGRWGDRDANTVSANTTANRLAPATCRSSYSGKKWMHFAAPGDVRPPDSQSQILVYATTASSSSGASSFRISTGNAANLDPRGQTLVFASGPTGTYTVTAVNYGTGDVSVTPALNAGLSSSVNATITQKYYRAWEQMGSQTFHGSWMAAIDGGADLVQNTTWNDYGENAHITPSTNHGWVWADLNTYYVKKFKTGSFPLIVRDGVYLFHRVHPVALTSFTDTRQKRFGHITGGTSGADIVEVRAFIAPGGAAATVELLVDGVVTQTASATAGDNRFEWPLPASGVLSARVKRSGAVVPGTVATSNVTLGVTQDGDDLHYRAFSSLRQYTGT